MRRAWTRWAGRAARVAALLVAAACWTVVAFELAVRLVPYPDDALASTHGDSIRLLARDGRLLREVVNRDGARAVWTPLERINPLAIRATIAVEDHRFWDHDGIDEPSVLRAAFDNVTSGRVVSGASTLTMQLARLVRPHAKTLRGKIGEAFDARRIERTASKWTILEQYLNRAPYGAGTIGIEAASHRYFGKPSAHLSLAEAALLAGLPKAPTRLNPLAHPEAARRRQRHVLERMFATGAIEAADYERALREPLVYRRRPGRLRAMHFTDFVLARGAATRGAVTTTLDLGLQSEIEDAVASHVASLAEGGVTNAAAVVLDNERCQIRAMIGSADYFSGDDGMVNGALARRQPGSTLKPFTYALAFEAGDTPATVVADIETHYGAIGGDLFSPQNFSNTFSGPVRMGAALGRSLNVPAIRIAERVGADALLDRLRLAGFASLDQPAEHYGLGLTLGNGEVTLLELAQGYAAFARGGLGCRAIAVDDGAPQRAERVFDERIAFLVTDVLSDESLRVAAFGPANALLLGFPVAVKTGTSSNWRDTWAVGYTNRFTVAVWSGDFSGRPMNHLAGASGAGPLFHKVMSIVVDRDGAIPPAPRAPAGVAEVTVCALSGALPSPSCPHRATAHVQADRVPSETCDMHRQIPIDRRNGLRAGPHCPDEFVERRVYEQLPAKYAAWQASHQLTEPPPPSYSPLCPADGPVPGAVVIRYPRDGEVFVIEPGYDRATQTLELAAELEGTAGKVAWYVDDNRIATTHWPYAASWPLSRGTHTVRAVAPGQRTDAIAIEVR